MRCTVLAATVLSLFAGAGCRVDTKDWAVFVDGVEQDGVVLLGAGLTTRVYLAIRDDTRDLEPLLFDLVRPEALAVLPEGELDFVVDSDREGVYVEVTVDEPGPHRFDVIADNIGEKKTVELDVREVDRVTFAAGGEELVTAEGMTTTVYRFVASEVDVEVAFFADTGLLESGDGRLPGTAPFTWYSEARPEHQEGSVLTLGAEPALLELGTPVGPERLRLHVLDEAGIGAIELEAPDSVRADSVFQVRVSPLPEPGAEVAIRGAPPIAFAVEGPTVRSQNDFDFAAEAGPPGTLSIAVEWAAARAELDLEVTP